MTPALASHADQVRHYAAVRQRLWPSRLQFVAPRVVTRLPWSPPHVEPLCRTDEERFRLALELLHGRRPTLALIRRVVADVCDRTVADLVGTPRSRRNCEPRGIAMALARFLLSKQVSRAMIGAAFAGRDPTTVLYAFRKHRATIERVATSLQLETTA